MYIVNSNGEKNNYYVVIEEIWELEYGPIVVPLFRCEWVAGGGVTKDRYGMTIVDFKKIGYKDEPFVLAKDVTQVFYVKDMSSKPKKKSDKTPEADKAGNEPKRHIVLPGKRKVVGVEDISDNLEDYDQIDTFLHSQLTLTLASSYPKRTHLTYAVIMLKALSSKGR